MMNVIAFSVLVCVATAQANPLSLLVESSQTIADIPIFTPEDASTYIRITEQDESVYSTLMTDNTADYGLLLNSRVIAAYNVSQIKGQCATTIERQTTNDWYGIIETSRQQITNSTEVVKKALFTSTPGEFLQAVMLYAEHKKLNWDYFMQFVYKLNDSYVEAVKGIFECRK